MSNNKSYPLSMPLDVEQFKTVTGGKNTYQEDLLELYFLNSAECVVAMERSMELNDNKIWQNAIEELKNISGNIGAIEISKVCDVAAKTNITNSEEKKETLNSIKTHIQRLRAFVRNTGY